MIEIELAASSMSCPESQVATASRLASDTHLDAAVQLPATHRTLGALSTATRRIRGWSRFLPRAVG